jgi:hypothetical protein
MTLCLAITAAMSMTRSGATGAAEADLVAYYAFDEGAGAVLHDRSGHGNDGRIHGAVEWVRTPNRSALAFNGKDTYVDCGQKVGLDTPQAGSVEIWFRPQAVQGGLVTRSSSGSWHDERLVLAFNTYGGNRSLLWCLADGSAHQPGPIPIPPLEAWTHLVLTFDGHAVEVFQNGLLVRTASQQITPRIGGVPLRIGRCEGLGVDYFHGQIGEVRLYQRALSEREIFERYVRTAPARGVDLSALRRPRATPRLRPALAQLLVEVDLRGLRPLPPGASVEVELQGHGQQPARRGAASVAGDPARTVVVLSIAGLAAGDCEIRVAARDAQGKPLGPAAREKWTLPATAAVVASRATPVRMLNNLVTELADVTSFPDRRENEWTFTNPREGWVFLRCTAAVQSADRVHILLDSASRDQALMTHHAGAGPTLEAMRYLTAGPHRVRAAIEGKAALKHLTVRSVPELIFCKFPYNPHVPEYGPYDWDFLKRHVLPHINVIVGDGDRRQQPFVGEWRRRGGRWIVEMPATPYFQKQGADEAYRFWSESAAFQNPQLDGAIVDEFGGGEDPRYVPLTASVRRLFQNERYRGKVFYPYCGSMFGAQLSETFIQAVIDGGSRFAWERYLPEQPTEQLAARFLDSTLTREMEGWEKRFPGCAERMIACLGYMVITESLNINPRVDWKVWMDMQFHHLATEPAFCGLYGLMEYTCGYTDEETVRWAACLYRHYGLEGRTELLSREYGFKYQLDHLQNPDFEDGLTGWTVDAAEEGSAGTRKLPGYSWLQGRYPQTRLGDTFLWTKRSGRKPNRIAQPIRNLQPGRLYSLKMITADYGELSAGRSTQQKHAVAVRIEGGELIPEKCFQSTVPNNYAHGMGPFNAQNKAWMNYHWQVFRARDATANLVLTDWAGPQAPGCPIAQTLMYNFIEVQPYFGP